MGLTDTINGFVDGMESFFSYPAPPAEKEIIEEQGRGQRTPRHNPTGRGVGGVGVIPGQYSAAPAITGIASHMSILTGVNLRTFGWRHLNAIREVTRKSAFLQAYMRQKELNVVGSSGPEPNFDKITGKSDRKRIQDLWDYWKRDPSVDGKLDWPGLLARIVTTYATDGRTFALHKYHDHYRNGFGILPLSRDWQVSSFSSELALEERRVHGVSYDYRNGVYYDQDSGRVRGYDFYAGGLIGADGALRTSKKSFIYARDLGVLQNKVGAYNVDNVPEDLLSVLLTINQVADIDSSMAEVMKKSALMIGVLESKGTSLDSELRREAGTELEEILGTNPLTQSIPPRSFMEENGKISILPYGHELNMVSPDVPSGNIVQFRRELLKAMFAALGLDYYTMAGDLENVNYSSLRHGALMARETWFSDQANLEVTVAHGILIALVTYAYLTGQLTLTSSRTLEELYLVEWRHRTFAWPDPEKDMKANEIEVALGINSPQRIAAGLGRDYNRIQEELDAHNERIRNRQLPGQGGEEPPDDGGEPPDDGE